MLQPLAHPSIPDLRLTALPLSFDGERALHRSAPPAVGEHTSEILREAGLRERRDRGTRRGRSDPDMSHVSASFSATIRVRLADAPGSFARLAEAIGDAGGSLGAIDLVRVEQGHEDPRRHRRRLRRRPPRPHRRERPRDRRRRGRARLRPHVPHAPRRQDRDALEGAGQDARRPLDGLHARRRADLPWPSHDDRDSAWNLTIKQNTVAVVSDGTAVLGLGDIGARGRDARDGGQGAAVQGVRRRRRLAALPRHEGHRRDRRDREGDRARLRRHQPRGHLGAALLRDRGSGCAPSSTSPSSTTTSTAPRSSCSRRC